MRSLPRCGEQATSNTRSTARTGWPDIHNTIKTNQFAYLGVDISKSYLDFFYDGHEERFENTKNGASKLARLTRRLTGNTPPMIVVEATGIYHKLLLRALERAGIVFLVLNPKRSRDFARSTGQLAKTDAIDARILAQIGSALELGPRPAPPAAVRALQDLESVRDALVGDLRGWKNRLQARPNTTIARYAKVQINQLELRITRIETEVARAIASNPVLAAREAIILTVCGVGTRTAAALLAWMPELGSLTAGATGALLGTAPFACDSGEHRGKRKCWGGRSRPREALWMASLSAKRFNPEIRAVYERLIAKGKPEKVARIALIRKMAIHINTLLKPLAYDRYLAIS